MHIYCTKPLGHLVCCIKYIMCADCVCGALEFWTAAMRSCDQGISSGCAWTELPLIWQPSLSTDLKDMHSGKMGWECTVLSCSTVLLFCVVQKFEHSLSNRLQTETRYCLTSEDKWNLGIITSIQKACLLDLLWWLIHTNTLYWVMDKSDNSAS